MTAPDVAAARPTRDTEGPGGRPWLMLTVLLLGQFMALVDVTIVNVAVPTIGVGLHASGSSLQLIVGGYTVAYGMLLITGARLGDLYGKRLMYLIGGILFTAGSLVCGIAPDSSVLIIARFVQGAGAAAMVPQIMSVIQMQFTGSARAKALSMYMVVMSSGAVVGMVVGGVLVSADLFGWSWRPVFLINVPLGVLLAVLVPRLVPADEPRGGRRLDLLGLCVATPAVLLVVLPLVLGHEAGWAAWTYLCIAAGLVLTAVFVRIERRIAARGGDPLLNLGVLHASGVPSGLVTLACLMISFGGFMFVFALHMQSGLGDSALRAGLTFAPLSAMLGLSGFYWRSLPARVHPWLPAAGLAICALGYLGIAVGLRDSGQNSPLLWICLLLFGLGMGSAPSLMAFSLVKVPPAQAPDASGLLTTTMQIGQLIGVAVFGTLYLSLAKPFPPHSAALAHSSSHAIFVTMAWMVPMAAVGALAGTLLARTVVRAKRPAAAG
jgi:MFS family permease